MEQNKESEDIVMMREYDFHSKVRFAPGDFDCYGHSVRSMEWTTFHEDSDRALWKMADEICDCDPEEAQQVFLERLKKEPSLTAREFRLTTDRCEYVLHERERKATFTYADGKRYALHVCAQHFWTSEFAGMLNNSLYLLKADSDEAFHNALAKMQLLGIGSAVRESAEE